MDTDEELIDSINDLANHMSSTEEPPDHVLALIGAVDRLTGRLYVAVTPARRETMETIARRGYFTRMAEGVSVSGAGVQSEEVADALQTCLDNRGSAESTGDAIAECAARFAMHEPLKGSAEDMEAEGSLLAVVPGAGHEARLTIGSRMSGASVANETYDFPVDDEAKLQALLDSDEYQAWADSEAFHAAAAEVFRGWLYGYFVRVFEGYLLASEG